MKAVWLDYSILFLLMQLKPFMASEKATQIKNNRLPAQRAEGDAEPETPACEGTEKDRPAEPTPGWRRARHRT